MSNTQVSPKPATTQPTKRLAVEQRYFNTQQAAAMYGVSDDTLIGAVKAQKLRAKRTGENGGGKYLFKIAWLDAWADALVDA